MKKKTIKKTTKKQSKPLSKKVRETRNVMAEAIRNIVKADLQREKQTYTIKLDVPTEFTVKHEKSKPTFFDSMVFYALFFFGCWCLGWILGPLFTNLFTITN